MTLHRCCGIRSLLFLLLLSEVAVANPKNKTFDAPVDEVFKAAKKAAAGHRILIPQDEGLKNLTDSGEEIKSFQSAISLPGVTLRVIEEISVEPVPEGTSKFGSVFSQGSGINSLRAIRQLSA
jgi:hypothetical protein